MAQTNTTQKVTAAAMQAKRGGWSFWLTTIGIAATVVAFIPGVGGFVSGGLSHLSDRISSGSYRRRELKLRTDFYRNQIAATLEKNPASVTVGDFKRAASINPAIAKLYNEPFKREKDELNSSLMVNAGAGVAGALVPGGSLLAHGAVEAGKSVGVVKGLASVGGGFAGGGLAGILAGEKVSVQEMVEGLDAAIDHAQATGANVGDAINPHLIFMLRVLQDDTLAATVKQGFGKPVNKMSTEELNVVMANPEFSALADAANREAHMVVSGNISVRDLAATKPNLKPNFGNIKPGNAQASHVARLAAERAANTNNVAQRA